MTKKYIILRFLVTYFCVFTSFIFTRIFQWERIDDFIFFSALSSIFLLIFWLLIYNILKFILLILPIRSDYRVKSFLFIISETLCMYFYIIAAYLFHYGLAEDPNYNFSAGGAGGVELMVHGVFTEAGVRRAFGFFWNSTCLAMLVHFANTILFFAYQKHLVVKEKIG